MAPVMTLSDIRICKKAASCHKRMKYILHRVRGKTCSNTNKQNE